MPILAVGLSHHEAPLEFRERLAIPANRLNEVLDGLAAEVTSSVVLSTCNRIELYAVVGHHTSGLRAMTRFLASWSGLPEDSIADHVRSYWQEDAIRHLFRVAAGLDSMIVGEGQILGQVRQSAEQAARRHLLEPNLARLFDRAIVVGKRARTETGIARSAVSVSQAAVDLARRSVGGLERATVLVIGTGKMGSLAARAMRQRGAARILVTNRTAARAGALAMALGGENWPFSRLDEGLQLADIVISSTGAPEYVVTRDRLAPLICARDGRPLVIVDIAVPRDVEPTVGTLDGVGLFNVDHLQEYCEEGLEQRRGEVASVEAIVEQEVATYLRWWESREVAPTVSELVRKAEAIRREELARTLGRLGELTERDANAINALTQAIVNKMLHAPIMRLKERSAGLDSQHYVHAVRDLFDLGGVEPSVD